MPVYAATYIQEFCESAVAYIQIKFFLIHSSLQFRLSRFLVQFPCNSSTCSGARLACSCISVPIPPRMLCDGNGLEFLVTERWGRTTRRSREAATSI